MGKKATASNVPKTGQIINIDALAERLNHFSQHLHPYRVEIAGVVLMVTGILVVMNTLGLISGYIPERIGLYAGNLFGWGAIPVAIAIIALGGRMIYNLFQETPIPLPYDLIVGVELILISGLALVHLAAGGNDPLAMAQAQQGGGYVGWALSTLFSDWLGEYLTAAIFIMLALTGLPLALRLNKQQVTVWYQQWMQSMEAQTEQASPAAPHMAAMQHMPEVIIEPPAPPVEIAAPVPPPAPPTEAVNQPVTQSTTSPVQKPVRPQTSRPTTSTAPVRPNVHINPPPLTLLAPPAPHVTTSANIRHQAQIIEETLVSFGVPAKVVEINRGPTVTQFGVKPGTITRKKSDGTVLEQRVRVSKINSLINDLALALAAAPLRIETPVPGRPIVGIEVPNRNVAMVALRSIMQSDAFTRKKGALKFALGKGAAGAMSVVDLVSSPHLLIAGATGSGKSVCINAIISSFLMTHGPDTLRLLMIDPKMVELVSYNGIPHLIAPVVTDFEQVAGALAWVTREMERRYKLFSGSGARNITGYNNKAKAEDRLPYMVVIIDELADLMMMAADEVERYIARIAQMARATGIHMIIATQRPSTDVVTGLIKANFPARIAFAVSSQIDSRVILDSPGAEKLLGKGDMLYMAPDSPKMARLQGAFVSDDEINNLVNYWKRAGMSAGLPLPEKSTPEALPWAGILEEANKDEIMEEAIQVILDTKRASTSFLQRKLGIGYPRASRLMDQLEEEGVVGPADRKGNRDILWESNPETEDLYEN